MSSDELTTRHLRQRSVLAEFALRAMGTAESVSMAEAASDAVCEGLDVAHAAVFLRRSYGLDLLACAGWPMTQTGPLEVPPSALTALDRNDPVDVVGQGEIAFGLAARADGEMPSLLVAADAQPLDLDADDRSFFADIAAVLQGSFARARTERSLRESEARARTSEAHAYAVLDTTVDGIITIDAQRLIQSFNPAAETIFGYRAAEVVGKNVSMLMPEPYQAHHDEYVQSYLETGRRRIIGIGREVVGRRRDGSTFPMDLAVSEVVVPGLRLFTGIVRDISARRALEREVVEGIEQERRNLGHELHDELGQDLSGIRLLTRDLARQLATSAPDLSESADEIAELIRRADYKARQIARGLVQVNVDAEGLASALRAMVEHAERLFEMPITLSTSGTPTPIPDAAATHIYRIAQEAITNAARHAAATQIRIDLDWRPAGLMLSITDDGSGIPGMADGPSLVAPVGLPRKGLGLQAMNYRARLIGGVLDFTPAEPGGTCVTCTLPIEYVPSTGGTR